MHEIDTSPKKFSRLCHINKDTPEKAIATAAFNIPQTIVAACYSSSLTTIKYLQVYCADPNKAQSQGRALPSKIS